MQITKSVFRSTANANLWYFVLPVPRPELSWSPPFNPLKSTSDRVSGLQFTSGNVVLRGFFKVNSAAHDTSVYFFTFSADSVLDPILTAEALSRLSSINILPVLGAGLVAHIPAQGIGAAMADLKKLVRGQRTSLAKRCDELLERQARQEALAKEREKRLGFVAAYSDVTAMKASVLSPLHPGVTTHRFSASVGPNIQEVSKLPVGEIAFGGSAKRFSSDEFIGYDAGIPGTDRINHESPSANLIRRGTAKTFSLSKAVKTAPAKSKRAKQAPSAKTKASKTTKTK